MMEKDYTDKELERLIGDWADELLPQDIDDQIADSLMDFVENDDTEIEENELLDFHIHQLAMEETIAKSRKWKRVISFVAAASVVILFGAIIFVATREPSSPTEKILAIENQPEPHPVVIDNELPIAKRDSAILTTPKAMMKENPKVASTSSPKRIHRARATSPKETEPEISLIATFTEINSGVENLVDNTRECITMTNENLNVMETNLINALYEIRSANIELNFDNKTTEI